MNPTLPAATRYGDGIEAAAGEVYDYHSENDDIVCETDAFAEETSGIGCVGADCGILPVNSTDVDVTGTVDQHCDYGEPDVGRVPGIVANF